MTPQLDIYLYSPHEVPVWAPVLGPLRARGVDARFVLEPPGRNVAWGSAPDPARGWLDVKTERLVSLVDAATEQAVLAELTKVGEEPLRRRRLRASGGTTQGSSWVRGYSGARARMMYGVGLVNGAYGHGVVNRGFDLVLVHGPFSAAEIALAAPGVRTAVVGFPKWAAFRRGEVSRERARDALGVGRSGPPVLAWLPTWAHRSSLSDAPALASLAETFEVVMKPHHNSARFESGRLSGLPPQVIAVPASSSLVDLLAAADVVVADLPSGGFTEALLADRPVVVLAQPGDRDRAHAAVTEVADLCADPAGLPALAARAYRDDPCAEGRRRWAPELFGDTRGRDDELAAEALAGVVTESRSLARVLAAAGWRARQQAARLANRR